MSAPLRNILAIGDDHYFQSVDWNIQSRDILTFGKNAISSIPDFSGFDAICILISHPSEAHLGAEILEILKTNQDERPIILIASNLRMQMNLYTDALNLGVSAIFPKEEYSFQTLQPKIQIVIDCFLPVSVIKLIFPLPQEIENQISHFFESMSGNEPCCYAIQGERGSGKNYVLERLKRHKPDLTFHFINCEFEVILKAIPPNTVIVVTGIEASVALVQEQLSLLLQKAQKVIFLLESDFNEVAQQGFISLDLVNYIEASNRIEIPALKTRLDDLQTLIQLLLEDSTVCPRYLKAYFGKTSDEVFDKSVLALFSAYHWPLNLTELRETVQSAIAQVTITVPDNTSPVAYNFLPRRIVYGKADGIIKWNPRKESAKVFLDDLEEELKNSIHNTWESIEKSTLQSEKLLRQKLRRYHDEYAYPDFFDGKRYPGIFQKFGASLFIGFDSKSKSFFDRLHTHMYPMLKKFPFTLSDNHKITGFDQSQILLDFLGRARIICFLFCADFISGQDGIHKELFAYLREKRSDQHLFSIITRPCQWPEIESMLGTILPNNRKPLSLNKNNFLEAIINEIIENEIQQVMQMQKFKN